jgi:uncharacterized protein
MKLKTFALLALLMLFQILGADEGIPSRPEAWVSDYAGILSSRQKEELNSRLSAVEKRSSNQIFVALFRQIPEGHYLDDFVNRLYEKWRPGLKDKDNGIIIAIFIKDRKMRIEVGYGLEDVITDAQASTVIREYMAPYFRKGDYYGGISKALDVIIPAAEGKYKIPVKKKKKGSDSDDVVSMIIFLVIMILVFKSFGGGGGGMGTRRRGGLFFFPLFFGGGGSSGGFGGGSGGFGGGGFGGGFGGMSGGGGASGGW